MPAKPNLRLVKPATQKRAVTPRRRPNSELRSREHLTETEVERLIEAAKDNRYGHRDATTILVAYRHGLRASEVCDLRWEQIDWNSATLHVRRVKSGKPSTHPVRGDELRALRKLKREEPKSPFVFVSERGGPFTTDSFNWMIRTLSDVTGETCREYVRIRGSHGGARRDLEDLRAAINHHAAEGFHRGIVRVVLPAKGL